MNGLIFGYQYSYLSQQTHTLVYSSTNGLTWTGLGSTIFTIQGNDAIFGNNIWIATGQGINTLATSTNGISWIGLSSTIFSSIGYGIAW